MPNTNNPTGDAPQGANSGPTGQTRETLTEEQLQAVHVGGLTPLSGPILIVDYDSQWPRFFEREAERIRTALGERVLLLEHVGSTSVPGLAAKPRIDILLVVPNSADEPGYVPTLEAAGYVLRIREPDWYEHRVFKGPDTDVNLHVFSTGCPEIERMLLFRDWLRSHPADRQLYERTKRELARKDWKYTQNYADAKTAVVEEILARAREGKEAPMEPVNLFDYEALAQARMETAAWGFYQGGSDDEVTLRSTRSAFERIRLRPRVLVDVTTCDTRTTVLGTPVSMPILVAPTAMHCLAHPEGECATVQGVGRAGTLMIASTVATRTMEEIAQAATGPLWFQLYVYGGIRTSEKLVQRAEAAGYRAIVLTVDLPRLGNRERDLRNNFNLPSHLREANFAGEEMLEIEEEAMTLTWDSLAWLRSITSLPIVVKGILTAEDAELAVQYGVNGIVVSNHGGRQLDTALASIEALPEIVDAVAGRCEVYMDGGIRRGTDILKALAFGARAVLVGRPILWGLAANGAEGVYGVLEILHQELERSMALAGRPTLQSIDRSLIRLALTSA